MIKIFLKYHILINYKRRTIWFGMRRRVFKYLGENIRFGGKCVFNRTGNISIGSDVFFAAQCFFDAFSEIRIGNGCMFGPRVFCFSGSHNYDSKDLRSVPYDNRQIDLPIIIEDNVWVAGNVSIAPGSHIGEGSVIGMGAVVAGYIPPFSVVVGNKAHCIKKRDINRYQELVAANKIYSSTYAGKDFELVQKNSLS